MIYDVRVFFVRIRLDDINHIIIYKLCHYCMTYLQL